MRSLLIGLGHKARQGKDTAAQAMLEASEGRAKLYSFAEELKRYCAAHHEELVLQYPYDLKPPKQDPIYGWTGILQWYGSDVVRKQDPNHWIKALAGRIEADAPEVAIVVDVRFLNEARWIKDCGGSLVEIIRRDADGLRFIDPTRDASHPSETDLDGYIGWDYIIQATSGHTDTLKIKARIVYQMVAGK